MARYVIVIKADPNSSGFAWEVRELLSDITGSVLERSGLTLSRGVSATSIEAKNKAETEAERLALEEAYVYNTTTQDPTPLP